MVTVTQVTLEQLAPYTNYTFYVVAYNGKAASQHSELAYQVTEQDGM